MESFKYVGTVVASDGRRNKEIVTQIDETNAVLRELHRSAVAKRELSNTITFSVLQSVFVPILTYDHESWIRTERIVSQMLTPDM